MKATRLDDLLTYRDVSALLDVKEVTLRSWRHRGYGPPSFKIGTTVVYRRADLIKWLEAQPPKDGAA